MSAPIAPPAPDPVPHAGHRSGGRRHAGRDDGLETTLADADRALDPRDRAELALHSDLSPGARQRLAAMDVREGFRLWRLFATGHPVWLLNGLLCGYGFAWVGHFFFEKNRPATFKHPFYSFAGDWVMFKDIIVGKIRF